MDIDIQASIILSERKLENVLHRKYLFLCLNYFTKVHYYYCAKKRFLICIYDSINMLFQYFQFINSKDATRHKGHRGVCEGSKCE